MSATEINIGGIFPFSGPASSIGLVGKGVSAYVQSINDQGGINGRKISYIAMDDAYSPPKAAGYGTTETAPTIATTHWATDTPGELGLPAPGVELKLIPAGDTFEARVRGPNVMPGYLGRPDLTSAAFDEEGFYRVGDTISFIDPANPSRGLRFSGRVSENFKLEERHRILMSAYLHGGGLRQGLPRMDGLRLAPHGLSNSTMLRYFKSHASERKP
ncbi:hypothetical protein ABIF90_008277 [Bradyrhizobium japonicum]